MSLKPIEEEWDMKECDVRTNLHVPGRATRQYGVDTTGTILYEFNSKGYRGEEYNPAAAFRICVIGESHGFGVGVSAEDTFGSKLKQHLAAALRLGADEINLVNLSAGGASADYCVRTLYRQIPVSEFNLVICQLPPPNRAEYFDGGTFHMYAANAVTPQNRERMPIPLVAFCDYYNEQLGAINQMRNMLLTQAFLKEREIGCIVATEDFHLWLNEIDDVADYLGCLDTGSILPHQYFANKADRAAGGRNAGRRCHAAFAIELLGFLGRKQVEQGNETQGRQIGNHAAQLMAADEDWKFCKDHIANSAAKRAGAGD